MKRILKYIPIVALVALVGTSCSVDEIEGYHDNSNNVYFDFEDPDVRKQISYLNWTFFDDPAAEEMEVEIPVRISGPRVDYDRFFNVAPLTIDPATLPSATIAAARDTDYELNPVGKIPAGEGMGYVELTLKNTNPLMASNTFILKLDLVQSDDFTVQFSGGDPGLNTATIRYSRMLVMPFWWNGEITGSWIALKTWSATANELFRIATGLTELELGDPGVSPLETNRIIAQFTDMMKDPQRWILSHPGYSIVYIGNIDGMHTFTFTDMSTGKVYQFRENLVINTMQWFNPATGAWDIFYQ